MYNKYKIGQKVVIRSKTGQIAYGIIIGPRIKDGKVIYLLEGSCFCYEDEIFLSIVN